MDNFNLKRHDLNFMPDRRENFFKNFLNVKSSEEWMI